MKKLSVTLLAMALIACSSPQDATESNFKSAIQEYYTQKQACFSLNAAFPHEVAKSDYSYKKNSEILNELVAIGFLNSTETEKEVRVFLGQSKKKEPAVRYELTEKGKGVTKETEKAFLSLGGTNFCYGNYAVEEITNFTEPSDFMGEKVSKVKYTYKAKDIASWVKENDVLKNSFNRIAKDIASIDNPIEGKAALILTNNGWTHEKLFKK